MTNKTNEQLIDYLEENACATGSELCAAAAIALRKAADALQASQKNYEDTLRDYHLVNDDRFRMTKRITDLETKLAAIRDAIMNDAGNLESLKEILSAILGILNTTNAQPAQEQGGKE